MACTTKTKDQFVSAAGTAFNIIERLSNAVTDAGGSNADLRRILSDPALAPNLANVIMRQALLTDQPTLAELIDSCGFVYVSSNITDANFPRSAESSGLPKEVHLDWELQMQDVVAELDMSGWRPASIHELAQYACTDSTIGQDFPLVALGSLWRDMHGVDHVAHIWGFRNSRSLQLAAINKPFSSRCRFLVVSK